MTRGLLLGGLITLTIAAGCQAVSTPDDDDVASGLFEKDRLVDVSLTIAPEALERIMADPFAYEYVPATFTYDGEAVTDVAVRIKGNLQINFMLAKNSHKFSFKVDFNRLVAEQRFRGLKKLNIHNVVNDPSFLREQTAYQLMLDGGVAASRIAYVNLTVNNELYGVYNLVEQIDSVFLDDWFGNHEGNLYKPEGSTLIYQGDSPGDYDWERFGLENNESDPDHSRLIALMELLDLPGAPDFTDRLEATFDVESLLRFLAINSFIINLDTYSPLGHNYYLYDDPISGKFVFIPWDMTEAFGNFACRPDDEMLNLDVRNPYCSDYDREQAPLFRSVLDQPEYMNEYLGYVTEYTAAGAILDRDALSARLRALHAHVAEAVAADPLKYYPYSDFVTNLDDSVPNRAQDVSAAPPNLFGLTQVVEVRASSVMSSLGE